MKSTKQLTDWAQAVGKTIAYVETETTQGGDVTGWHFTDGTVLVECITYRAARGLESRSSELEPMIAVAKPGDMGYGYVKLDMSDKSLEVGRLIKQLRQR